MEVGVVTLDRVACGVRLCCRGSWLLPVQASAVRRHWQKPQACNALRPAGRRVHGKLAENPRPGSVLSPTCRSPPILWSRNLHLLRHRVSASPCASALFERATACSSNAAAGIGICARCSGAAPWTGGRGSGCAKAWLRQQAHHPQQAAVPTPTPPAPRCHAHAKRPPATSAVPPPTIQQPHALTSSARPAPFDHHAHLHWQPR